LYVIARVRPRFRRGISAGKLHALMDAVAGVPAA
jgi:hypothetical protein